MRIRLRQIVMVAAELDDIEREIVDELGVELCFRDPGVGEFGLRNALFPIGDKLLEVVSPTEPGTTAGRYLDRRGGDGGYMVIFEVDDLQAFRDLVRAAGIRIVFEAVGEGITGIHLHPADVGGAIVSIDQADDWGEWPWAGPVWRDHVRTERVDDVVAVEVATDDPHLTASRWGLFLDRPPVDGCIHLDEGEVRFVPAGDRGQGVTGFVLRAAPDANPVDVTIAGCRFTSIR